MKDFITSAEVARLLDITPQLFRKRRETLIEDAAFPEPMPTSYRPMRWRADQVHLWIESHGRPRAMPTPERPHGHNVILLEEARRA